MYTRNQGRAKNIFKSNIQTRKFQVGIFLKGGGAVADIKKIPRKAGNLKVLHDVHKEQ
jgi:hypothetical protein